MDFVLQADAMRDQVGFPDYLVNKTKFAKRFKKYSNVSRKYNFVWGFYVHWFFIFSNLFTSL